MESVRNEEGGPAAEKKSAQMLLLTFMIAAGALTGVAFYGVEAAILAVLDGIEVGGQALSLYSWWPYARLGGFVMINAILGLIIYTHFSAGPASSEGAREMSHPDPLRLAHRARRQTRARVFWTPSWRTDHG